MYIYILQHNLIHIISRMEKTRECITNIIENWKSPQCKTNNISNYVIYYTFIFIPFCICLTSQSENPSAYCNSIYSSISKRVSMRLYN